MACLCFQKNGLSPKIYKLFEQQEKKISRIFDNEKMYLAYRSRPSLFHEISAEQQQRQQERRHTKHRNSKLRISRRDSNDSVSSVGSDTAYEASRREQFPSYNYQTTSGPFMTQGPKRSPSRIIPRQLDMYILSPRGELMYVL